MRTPTQDQNQTHDDDDDDDVKMVLTSPATSTSTQHLLDPSGNKIGELELNTFDNFAYASESFSTIIDRVVWGEQDTNLLLEKHESYISEVGPRKRFHSKKYMWSQIANDIYAKFKLIITGGQCENRYKTVCKRRKQLMESNSKSNILKTTGEEKSTDEPETNRAEGLEIHLERLEQTNQEVAQQIEQCSVRVLTMVERLERHHSRQQQKFEKLVLDSKDQLKTDFATLCGILDKIHNTIQQNQEQQQKLLEKLIKSNDDERKTEMASLLSILDNIYHSMKHNNGPKKEEEHTHTMVTGKQNDMKRSRSRSSSHRRGSKSRNSRSSSKKRRHSSKTRSRSSSKCSHNTSNSHTARRSKSNERHKAGPSSIRNDQHSPHSFRPSRYDRRHRSKSRSPRRSNHRPCQDATCKQHDKYR